MEMIPVTTEITGQRWLVLGNGKRAEEYQRSMRAHGAFPKTLESGIENTENNSSIRPGVMAVEPLLASGDLDGVICFDRAGLSPLQRERIKQAGLPLWLADSPSESSVILPDRLDSHIVPILVCVGSSDDGLINKFKNLWLQWREPSHKQSSKNF